MAEKIQKKYDIEFMSEHICVEKLTTYIQFILPDGRYFCYQFEPNHKLRSKLIEQLWKIEH